MLYLIEILHQTTTYKPWKENKLPVVSYRNSTSNHNDELFGGYRRVVVSYRNSTSNHNCTGCHSTPESVVSYRNSTSNHNCLQWSRTGCIVVSYRNSTSNHNWKSFIVCSRVVVSYRNSTSNHNNRFYQCSRSRLYLIEILHQTTTRSISGQTLIRCILSKFYIKPQLSVGTLFFRLVVSYRNSTSNHNQKQRLADVILVVSYRNSTSNHNSCSRYQ